MPLDAVVSTPAPNPATNADEFALQSFERLQEAIAFVREYSGKNIEHMKKRYDSSVKPQNYEIGERVLVYNPEKRRGKFAKWKVRWVGPYVVQNKLNSTNYVVKKGRSKSIVNHIDRLRKLPVEVNVDSADRSEHGDVLVGSPVAAQQSDIAAATAGSPYPMSDVTEYAGRYCAVGRGACPPSDGSSPIDAYPSVPANHSTDTAIVTAAASSESDVETNRPRPASPGRPVRTRRPPARFLETVQARHLATPNFAARAACRTTGMTSTQCTAVSLMVCMVVAVLLVLL